MNLFVARLSSSITGETLHELFSAHGEVVSAKVIFDRETGNSKGYGFVEMPNEEEANAAIAALNESELDGKSIVVKEANPPRQQERPRRDFNRGGGYNRGGGGSYNRGGDRRGGGGYRRRTDNRGGNEGYRRDDNQGGNSGGYDE